MENDILSINNLVQHFKINSGLTINAVNGISFEVKKGEVFGLVGESGCGKSTVAKSIMGLYSLTSGEIYFKGNKISDRKIYRQNKDDIHKNMQIIFQDSASALNPRMTVEKIIREPIKANHMYDKVKSEKQIDEILNQVGLDVSFRHKYPGEISGGQRQRVAIARSIAVNPQLIIADEPIASLDISIQAQIINLFQKLQREYGFSFLFIAHDLSIVRFLCNRVAVMVKGRIVETAPTEILFENPVHPYTKSLLSAIPVPDPKVRRSQFIDFDEQELKDDGMLKEISPEHYVYL